MDAANTAVIIPITAIKFKATWEWINADTGVGPSIASGSHVWNKNCADFPIAPINNARDINVIKFTFNPIKLISWADCSPILAKTSS